MTARPEWLIETEDNTGEYGAINNENTFREQNNPSWLTPQVKQQRKKSGKKLENTPLTEGRKQRRRKDRYRGGNANNDRLRLLEYKAGRPCCLSCFGILHATTIIAALLAVGSQFLDLTAIYQNNLINEHSMRISEVFELIQDIALHTYGMFFALLIVLIESSEFQFTNRWLKMCHNNVITEKWVIRGFIYNFIGLFALQSGREYAGIVIDESEDNMFIFDSPHALALIRYSGSILMAVGFVYMILGVSCCKSLKDYQMKELNKAREELVEYMEVMADGGRRKGSLSSMVSEQTVDEEGGVGMFLNQDEGENEVPLSSVHHWSKSGGLGSNQDSPPAYSRRHNLFHPNHSSSFTQENLDEHHSYENDEVFVRAPNQYEQDEHLHGSYLHENEEHQYEPDDEYHHEQFHGLDEEEVNFHKGELAYRQLQEQHYQEEEEEHEYEEDPHGVHIAHGGTHGEYDDAHRLWRSEEPNPQYEDEHYGKPNWK